MSEVAEAVGPKTEQVKEKPILVSPERMSRRDVYEYKKGLNERANARLNAAILQRQEAINRVAKDPETAKGDVDAASAESLALDEEARGVIETASTDADAVLGEQSLSSDSVIGDPKKGTALNVTKGTDGEVLDSREAVAGNQQESVQLAEKKSNVELFEEAIAQQEAQQWIEDHNITDPDKIAAQLDQYRRIYVGNGLNYEKFEANARREAAKIREKGPLSEEDTKEVVALAEEAEHWHTYANSIKVALAGDKKAEGPSSVTDEVSAEAPVVEGEALEEVVEGDEEDADNIEDADESPATAAARELEISATTAKIEAPKSATPTVPTSASAEQPGKPAEAKTEDPAETRKAEVELEKRLFALSDETRLGGVSQERASEIIQEVTESLEGNNDTERLIDGARIATSLKDPVLATRFLAMAEDNNQITGKPLGERACAEASCRIASMYAENGDIKSAEKSIAKAQETYPKIDSGNILYANATKSISRKGGGLRNLFRRK